MRALPAVFAVVLAVAACSPPDGSGQTPTTVPPPGAATTSVSQTTTTIAVEPPPNLEVFLAAVDDALQDTALAAAPLSDPEVFIGLGQLFCEMLDDGDDVETALIAFLDGLVEAGAESIEDDAFAAGVIMGASLEVLCPEHGGTG